MAADSQWRVTVLTNVLILIYLPQYYTATCPNKFPNGDVIWHCGQKTGDVCVFYCDKYFEAVPDHVLIECMANGEWNVNTTELCRRKICSPMPIPNGQLDTRCDRLAGRFCSYECDRGFTKLSAREVQCVGDDNVFAGWNTDPHKMCFLPAMDQCSYLIKNGHLEYNCTRLVGQKCKIICDNDYVAREETSLCNNVAIWSPNIYETCQAIACPTFIPNGRANFWCETAIGNRCSFTCNMGFEAKQETIFKCMESGQWSPNPSDLCQPVPEEIPLLEICTHQIPNGRLSPYCKSVLANECYYYCDINYEKLYDTIVCLSDGTWDKNPGNMCISSESSQTVDSILSINVGIGIGLVVILVICFVIFACFIHKRSHICQRGRQRRSDSLDFSHLPADSIDNDYPAFVAPPPLYDQLINEQIPQEAPPPYNEQLNQVPQSEVGALPPAYSDVIKDGTTLEIADAYRHNGQNTTQSSDYDNQAFALETVDERLQTELDLERHAHTMLQASATVTEQSASMLPDGKLSYI